MLEPNTWGLDLTLVTPKAFVAVSSECVLNTGHSPCPLEWKGNKSSSEAPQQFAPAVRSALRGPSNKQNDQANCCCSFLRDCQRRGQNVCFETDLFAAQLPEGKQIRGECQQISNRLGSAEETILYRNAAERQLLQLFREKAQPLVSCLGSSGHEKCNITITGQTELLSFASK